MSCVEGPPDGSHVAMTTPAFGEFVTVTSMWPESGLLATVTQSVWPFEVPHVPSALAMAGTTTVATRANGTIPSRIVRRIPL